MTSPSPRHPGVLYRLTRRVERRELRLRPDVEVSAAFAVAWVDAASRSGVRLACAAVLSDHYHAIVWDPNGLISEQLRDVHALVARFVNARDDVRMRLWDGQPTFLEEIVDADEAIEAMAYVMANPVKHRLVERPEQWPGLLTKVDDIGAGRGPVYMRPEQFFAADGPVSESVELLAFVPPMCEAAYGVEGFRARLRAAIARLVVEAHATKDGRGFVGAEAVLAQSVWHRPASDDQRSAGKAAEVGRRVRSSEDEKRRALVEAREAFCEAYAAARARFKAGERDVVFPAGTWLLWRYYGVRRATDEPEKLAKA